MSSSEWARVSGRGGARVSRRLGRGLESLNLEGESTWTTPPSPTLPPSPSQPLLTLYQSFDFDEAPLSQTKLNRASRRLDKWARKQAKTQAKNAKSKARRKAAGRGLELRDGRAGEDENRRRPASLPSAAPSPGPTPKLGQLEAQAKKLLKKLQMREKFLRRKASGGAGTAGGRTAVEELGSRAALLGKLREVEARATAALPSVLPDHHWLLLLRKRLRALDQPPKELLDSLSALSLSNAP